ncbi:MAG: hypothetical protein WCB14_05530, partial [Candidatus Acidiferrales bacterium]
RDGWKQRSSKNARNRRGLDARELSLPAGGEVFSLDIPFYRTRHSKPKTFGRVWPTRRLISRFVKKVLV